MGLQKDLSVVADSEMTSSPRSTTSSPAPIKRAARTYGRRRDPDSSFTYSDHDSKDSIYRTGPPDMSDEVPPSEMSRVMGSDDSGGEDEDEENVDGDVLPSSLMQPRFNFGWKEKLKQMDNRDDLSRYIKSKDTDATVSTSREQVALRSPSHVDTDIDSPVKKEGVSTLRNIVSKGPFDSSLSSFPSPSRSRNFGGYSSPKSSRNRLRTSRNVVKSGDEMEQDGAKDSRPSSPTTPPSHLIVTPKSQLTSSPPTSHGDDASANSASSSVSKAKGKAFRARHTVVPLHFNSHRPESFDNLEHATRRRSSLNHEEKKQKIKAPTKKELRETARERARIAAEQIVSMPKVDGSEDRSLARFFAKIAKRQGQVQSGAPQPSLADPPPGQHPSSPIDSFLGSQPQSHEHGDVSRSTATRQVTTSSSRHSPSPQRPIPGNVQLVVGNNSDYDEHLDVDTLSGSSKVKDQLEIGAKWQSLSRLKQQLVKRQNLKPKPISEDEDEELEVLPQTKIEEQRTTAQTKQLSKGRRMFLSNAQITAKTPLLNPHKLTKQELDHFQEDVLKHGVSDPGVLIAVMKQRAERESVDIVKQKEEEFVRLGGVVKKESVSMNELQANQILLEYAKKGIESWSGDSGSKIASKGDEEEDEDDSDWAPEGSMGSQGHQKEDQDEGLDCEGMEDNKVDGEGILAGGQEAEREQGLNQSDDGNEDLAALNVKIRKHLPRRVVDSDDSDSGEYGNATFSKSAEPLYTTSSSDDRTEDENDKENNTRLMFDRSEDKENKAVVRHQMLDSTSGPVRSLRSVFDDASDFDEFSLSPPHVMTLELEAEEGEAPGSCERRKSLGVIASEKAASPQQSPSTHTPGLAARSKHSPTTSDSLSEDVFGPAPRAPAFGGDDAVVQRKKPALGFSQFSQGGLGSMSFGAPTLLRPGFSDLFESDSQKGGLRRDESLRLTQDVALQPAFQVDEKLLRKADAIFEKEQEYLVEVAGKKTTKEAELYVNEVGLLTQTRPSTSGLTPRSPSFMLSPTQTGSRDLDLSLTPTQLRSSITLQSQPRPPLRTISLSNPQLSPEASPKRRLRKRGGTPTSRVSSARSPASSTILSTSPPLQRRNAFDILSKHSPRHRNGRSDGKGQGKEMTRAEKLIRREYLMDEAEESDEDQAIGFGFVKKREKGEDEEGGDMDASLPELVDDRKMDAKTEGVEKVLEKHKELLEKDDDEAIKFHQGVVQGELRKKRKGQFGIDDSDEEDEEDDRARKIRRKMKERRERGDIQELAADEKTVAFANAYQAGIHDDELIELRPLDLEHDLRTERAGDDGEDVLMSDDQDDEQEDLGDGDGAEEGEGKRFVTHRDIQAEVRRMKEHPQEEVEARDLEDVSWIDEQAADADEMDLDVQVVVNRKMTGGMSTATSTLVGEWDVMGLGGIRRKENGKDLERLRAWAKNESRNITGTTGRVVGGIAVTGHGGSRVKSGGGSLRSNSLTSASTASSTSSLDGRKQLKSHRSVLMSLSKRKDQFQ